MQGGGELYLEIEVQTESRRGGHRAVVGIWTSRPRTLPTLEYNNRRMYQPWNITIVTCAHIYNSNNVESNIYNVM